MFVVMDIYDKILSGCIVMKSSHFIYNQFIYFNLTYSHTKQDNIQMKTMSPLGPFRSLRP